MTAKHTADNMMDEAKQQADAMKEEVAKWEVGYPFEHTVSTIMMCPICPPTHPVTHPITSPLTQVVKWEVGDTPEHTVSNIILTNTPCNTSYNSPTHSPIKTILVILPCTFSLLGGKETHC